MYLMSPLFFEKGGILLKGGHYIREDIIQGNTVLIEAPEEIFANQIRYIGILLPH